MPFPACVDEAWRERGTDSWPRNDAGSNGWLYDHRTDPYEMKNLIDSREHADVRRRLGDMILKFAERFEDPVLPELRAMLAE